MKYLKCPKCGEFYEENLENCPSCGWSESSSSPKVTMGEKMNVATTDTGTKHESILKKVGEIFWYISITAAGTFALYAINKFIDVNKGVSFPKNSTQLFWDIDSIIKLLIFIFVISGGLLLVGRLIQELCSTIANISINLHEINMKIKEEKTTEQ